jgi:hypothetical protein
MGETETVKTGDSSPPAKSLADVVLEAASKHQDLKLTDKKEPEVEEETPAEPKVNDDKPAEAGEQSVEKEPDAEPEKKEEEELPPFHEHPRWKEINTQLQDARPLAEQTRKLNERLSQHGVSAEQYEQAVNMAILLNTNPQEAFKQLQPLVDQLSGIVGDRLPEDLVKKVEDGIVDLDTAKEVARLRAERQFGEKRQQLTAQQQMAQSVTTSLLSWETSKKKNDPDYGRKVTLVQDRLESLARTRGPKTAADFVELAELAYADVTKTLNGYVPRPPTPPLPRNGSSRKPKSEPKTLAEVIQRTYERSTKRDE